MLDYALAVAALGALGTGWAWLRRRRARVRVSADTDRGSVYLSLRARPSTEVAETERIYCRCPSPRVHPEYLGGLFCKRCGLWLERSSDGDDDGGGRR